MKMLECEGHKMFYGTATISPTRFSKVDPWDETGTWLYEPRYDFWYVNGNSYPARIVSGFREADDYM